MSAKRTYAAGTAVTVQASRSEIEKMVRAAGANAFLFAEDVDVARISFRMEGRLLRFDIALPAPDEERFVTIVRGAAGRQARTAVQASAAYDRALRELWRALALTIKAKLTAVEAGIVTFEDEFLAHVVLADDQTVGRVVGRQLALHYEGRDLPRLLADYTGGKG